MSNIFDTRSTVGMAVWGTLEMEQAGGKPSTEDRREVDLYVSTDRVEDLHRQLKDRVEVRETLHDTFYGMREFIIRDINGFWITFGQEVAQT